MPERLLSFYHCNFTLAHNNTFTLTEVENMLPWEKTMYMNLYENQIQKEEEALRKLQEGLGN